MVYSNKFVLCVLVNKVPCEELANGVVKLPFGTEYELRFRNKHNRRAVVKFFIDGENVSGNGYIIPANDYVDIKRHHDLDRAFKFVSLDSPDAIDHGKNGPNDDKVKGTIEARFYLEKEKPAVQEIHHHHHHYPRPRPQPIWPIRPYSPYDYTICHTGVDNAKSTMRCTNMAGGGRTSSMNLSALAGAESCDMAQNMSVGSFAAPLQDGCTVEGTITGQTFSTQYIDTESEATVLKLFLQGYEVAVETPVVSPAKPARPTNKDSRLSELERQNEELRLKLAELENQKLKSELNAKKRTRKPRASKQKTDSTTTN